MSHELTDTDAMAYVGATPWHGLGASLPEGATVDEMATAANLTWPIAKLPIRVVDGRIIKDHFGLVRGDTRDTLDVVGKQYIPVQPREALAFFERFAEAGELKLETAGSLAGGRWVWGLARVNGPRFMGKGDELRNYTLLVSPNVHGKSLLIKQTSVRVVCWNTMTAALSGGGSVFRMAHSHAFDADMRETAGRLVEESYGVFDRFMAHAETMASVAMPRPDQTRYLADVFKLDPASLEERKADDAAKVRRSPLLAKFDEALALAPGSQTDAAKDTLWGAFNAVTWLCDHKLGRNQDVRLRESWLGYRETIKQRALGLALELAK